MSGSGFLELARLPLDHIAMDLTEQNKNRMIAAKPPIPLTMTLQNMPRAAVMEAFLVSSATWPEASNPINIPAVAR